MNVKTVDKNKLKIFLTYSEIISLFGSYENINFENIYSKATLSILYHKATANTDFNNDFKKMLIEVKPILSGCEICFTKAFENNTANNRIYCALIFNNSESLISFAKNYVECKSNLYAYKNKYILTISEEKCNEYLAHEYCEIIKNQTVISHLSEYAVLICKTDALKKIKLHFEYS